MLCLPEGQYQTLDAVCVWRGGGFKIIIQLVTNKQTTNFRRVQKAELSDKISAMIERNNHRTAKLYGTYAGPFLASKGKRIL